MIVFFISFLTKVKKNINSHGSVGMPCHGHNIENFKSKLKFATNKKTRFTCICIAQVKHSPRSTHYLPYFLSLFMNFFIFFISEIYVTELLLKMFILKTIVLYIYICILIIQNTMVKITTELEISFWVWKKTFCLTSEKLNIHNNVWVWNKRNCPFHIKEWKRR